MTLTAEEILWCQERTCMNIILNFRLPELSPAQIKILRDYGLLKRDNERTLDYDLTLKGVDLLRRTWEGKPARSKKSLGEILADILGEPWEEFKQGVRADKEKLKARNILPFPCRICGKRYRTFRGLKLHIAYTHGKEIN